MIMCALVFIDPRRRVLSRDIVTETEGLGQLREAVALGGEYDPFNRRVYLGLHYMQIESV